MKTLGVHDQAVRRAHGGHFAIRITNFPPEGHPGVVEEWECNLANTVAKKNLHLPVVAEVVGADGTESAEGSDVSSLDDMNEDATVEIVDEVCFTEETQVFKMSSKKAAKLVMGFRRTEVADEKMRHALVNSRVTKPPRGNVMLKQLFAGKLGLTYMGTMYLCHGFADGHSTLRMVGMRPVATALCS